MTLPHMHTDRHTQVYAKTHTVTHRHWLHPQTYIKTHTKTHINSLIGADINTHSTQICTNTDTQI